MHGQLTWQHENHMLNKAKMKFTSSSWVCWICTLVISPNSKGDMWW
jgi:hypothetical protein